MIPDCTLTTCCFDLTKYNNKSRNFSESLKNMKALLETPCYLVIFTDNNLVDHIKSVRNSLNLEKMTYYVVMNVEELGVFNYRDIVIKNREKYHPTKDERTCAESHLVCCSKFELVLKTIDMNPFNTEKFGWIDSNIGENFSKICTNYKNNMLLKVLEEAPVDKFSLQILNVCDKKFTKEENLREYYQAYRWVVCGCLFIANKELSKEILGELNNIFIKHTILGYGHAEEMFYLEVLDKYYDKINRSYGDYQHILNNFSGLTVGFDYIFNMSNLYLNYGYYKDCADCCSKVITQYEKFKVEINYELYFKFLFNLFVSYFYIDKENCKKTYLKLANLIKENPYIEKYYLSNKNFYDSQFSYIL